MIHVDPMWLQTRAQNYSVSELERSSGEISVSFTYFSLENAILSLGPTHHGQPSRASLTCGG